MQTHRFVCEICEAAVEVERSWTGDFKRPREWFLVRVARANEWHTQAHAVSDGWVVSYPDAWPGMARWQENVMPPQPVDLDLCSQTCAFQAMRKLHDGARIILFQGPDELTAQEISFVLNYRAKNPEDVMTA